MERRVTYHHLDLELELLMVFAGERIEIKELRVIGVNGFVATQYLTGLGLPRIIRAIAVSSIPGSARWQPDRKEGESKDLSYKFLAELYWFEHISWGSPRTALMNYTGWSRANTNWHLRRIAKEFPLPGPHSSGYQGTRHSDDPRG